MSDDIGRSVRDRLASTAEVAKLVQSQIYDDVLKQDAKLPAVVVFVPASTPHEDLNSSNRCIQATVEVLAWGRNRTEANAVAKAIRDSALPADLSGRVEGMDWKECSLIQGPMELVDAPIDGSDNWRRITKQVFSIWANAL